MVIAQLEFLVDTLSSKMFFFYYHFYCSSIIVIVMIIQCWEMEKLKLVLGESFCQHCTEVRWDKMPI